MVRFFKKLVNNELKTIISFNQHFELIFDLQHKCAYIFHSNRIIRLNYENLYFVRPVTK